MYFPILAGNLCHDLICCPIFPFVCAAFSSNLSGCACVSCPEGNFCSCIFIHKEGSTTGVHLKLERMAAKAPTGCVFGNGGLLEV